MKKNYLKFAAFAIMMALTACTSEVIEVSNPDTLSSNLTLGPGEDIVRINLTNTVSTRAARPISNSKADNNINRIAFKFLTSGGSEVTGITLEEVIDPSSGKKIEGYNVVDNVLQLPTTLEDEGSINIKFSNLGENTSYRIIAYGYNYDTEKDKQDAFPYLDNNNNENIKIGQKDNSGNYLLKCENLGTTTAIQEIFSGATNKYIGVNQHGKFEEVPQITMKRQVAALLVYFKDAPVFVNNEKVTKITVSTRYKGTGFYFPASLLNNPTYNGIGDDAPNELNNGWVHYLTFDMSKADDYNNTQYKSGDTYTFSNNKGTGEKYLLANETEPIADLKCQDNTLFGSCFLLPFEGYRDYYNASNAGHATLNICYWTTQNGTESLITRIPLKYREDNKDTYDYGILCNNFYHIGKKTTTGLPDPENPDEEDEKDEPTSIDEPTGWDYATVTIEEGYAHSNELFN